MKIYKKGYQYNANYRSDAFLRGNRQLHETIQHRLIAKKSQRGNCIWNIWEFIKSYFSSSSIHGCSYVIKGNITVFERFMWFALICICIVMSVIIGLQSIDRYYHKSTVVSLERDYFYWNTTLPSLTVCPMQRLNQTFVDNICKKYNIEGTDKLEFQDFMEHLANSTFINFDKIPFYASIDKTLEKMNIQPKSYMELIYNLTYDSTYEPDLSYRIRCVDGNINIHAKQVLTEYGLCYLTNSYLTDEYSSYYMIFGSFPPENEYEKKPAWKYILQGTYFGLNDGYSFSGFTADAFDVFIHSPHDTMTIEFNLGYNNVGYDLVPEVMEITTTDFFEDEVTVAQRHCRFQHESNLEHYRTYTRGMCFQECRLNLAYKLCNCIPHFYPNRIPKPKPVCNYTQLRECFPKYSSYLMKLYTQDEELQSGTMEKHCHCDQNCRDVIVSLEKVQVQTNMKSLLRNSIGNAVSMNTWPTQRLMRQVIYTFQDLLVSIGGTAGLCLGFSVLSLVEFVFFFTLRLICHLCKYQL